MDESAQLEASREIIEPGHGAAGLVDEDDVERLRARLHDTVLQTLEFIASGGQLGQAADTHSLMRLAAREATELRHYLEGLLDPDNAELSQGIEVAVSREACLTQAELELTFGEMDGTVDRMACLELVAAVREALTNARKHSQASHVIVHAEESDGDALIVIKDNGVGADLATLEPRLGMRHSLVGRMRRLGGSVEIDSSVGEGMAVTLRLPPPGETSR